MRTARILACLFTLLTLSACHGPGRVEFAAGQCLIDGRPATLSEVESRQAHISERIVGRQPLFVLITVLVVALAGASHIDKVILLFSTRREHPHSMADRLKLVLDRYRAHPLRYFFIVISTLSLLGVAAGCYVYLDADKRASERALGLLQFCHLALRNGESQNILAEQRRNLQQIESTAGNIQTLVDKLPPTEQRKAKEIVAQINAALGQQGKLVSDYAARTDESTRAVREQTENLQKGLTSLGTQVLGLKSLPASLKDVGEQLHALDGRVATGFASSDSQLGALATRLGALEGKVDALAKATDALRSTHDARSAGDEAAPAAASAGPAKSAKEAKEAPAAAKATREAPVAAPATGDGAKDTRAKATAASPQQP